MRKIHWFIMVILLLFPVIVLFYPYLPEQMGTHWRDSDVPNDYMGKIAGTFVFTIVLMIVIAILLAVNIWASKLSTKTYSSRKPMLFFDCFTVLFSIFLLTTYISALAWNAGLDFNAPRFSNINGGCTGHVITEPGSLLITKGPAGTKSL